MNITILQDWLNCKDIRLSDLYLVGGTVRDLLLGTSPKDVDLVCRGAKEYAQAIARCKNAAVVKMEKKAGEPCYRVVDRNDSERYLDIAEMRGETIHDDLGKRDFTIDAIAMKICEDMRAGDMIDPFNGAEDIRRRMIRQVSDRSIGSDPLRILRAFRLSATLGFVIDEQTLREMKSRVATLEQVSAERIMTELLLIVQMAHSSRFFRGMDEVGVLKVLFPEILAMKDCHQNGFHHTDVWEHSLLVMEQVEHIIGNLSDHFGTWASNIQQCLNRNKRLQILKLTALLHDIGKPSTKGLNSDTGRITFYGHDTAGAGMIASVAGRLKMSKQSRDFMVLLTAEHLQVLHIISQDHNAIARARWFRKMRDDAVASVILGMADIMSSRGSESTEEYRERFVQRAQQSLIQYYEKLKAKIEGPDLVSGKDLIDLGMEPGPDMGVMLERIRDVQDAGEISSREEALGLAKEMMARKD